MADTDILEELKKQYSKLAKHYGLPKFETLNREFEIEKIQGRETEFLLREIRHVISERIAAFLHFLELFLNPTTAPIFILNSLKALNSADKELIEKLYKELARIELNSIALDLNYNDKKEAAFIKNITKKWQELKSELEAFGSLLIKISPKQEKRKAYVG